MEPLLLTDKQVAELTGIAQITVWKHSRNGILPKPYKLGGSTRWKMAEIKNYIDALEG